MDGKTYESLTPMERNCLRLARHDCKAEQIANELGISASTVNTHVFNARRKLGGLSRLTAADMLRAYEAQAEPTIMVGTAPSRFPPEDPSNLQSEQGPDLATMERSLSPGAQDGVATPTQQISRQPKWMAPLSPEDAGKVNPADVREVRSTFVFNDEPLAPHGGKDGPGDETLRRIALVLAIAALMAIVAIAAPAIYDSAAMRIANSLERPHAR